MPGTDHTTDEPTNANAHNSESLVFAVANTNPSQETPTQQTKAPAWFLELTHQLRNFRQWRLIIKPDQTIDLDYLASLALQAQRRARPYTAPPQPTLFALEPLEAETINLQPANSPDMQLAINQTDSNTGRSLFTVINDNGQPSRLNAILLPDEILTIAPDEFLHDYLGRVAAAAVQAAIFACGSPEAAFIRLGSKPPQDHATTTAPPRPTLVLAPPRTAKPLK
jgi:hypothetical protein